MRVDGALVDELGLAGKPAPATFLEALRLLDIAPSAPVVVEDSEAGIEITGTGGFGLVIGICRTGAPDRLRRAGAHVVVNSLPDIAVAPPEPNTTVG